MCQTTPIFLSIIPVLTKKIRKEIPGCLLKFKLNIESLNTISYRMQSSERDTDPLFIFDWPDESSVRHSEKVHHDISILTAHSG